MSPQQQGYSDSPRAVYQEPGYHPRRMPSSGYRQALQGKDDKPRHQRWSKRTEQQRKNPIQAADRKPWLGGHKGDAPNSSPEGERPHLRHTQRPCRLHRKRLESGYSQGVKQREHSLVENHHRQESRRETRQVSRKAHP